MSHLVKAKIGKIKDIAALRKAVEECGGKWLGHGSCELYSTSVLGERFQLYDGDKPWQYACAVRDSDQELCYDNYHGRWGKQETLDKVVQLYAANCAKKALVEEGFTFGSEKVDSEGTLVLNYWKD